MFFNEVLTFNGKRDLAKIIDFGLGAIRRQEDEAEEWMSEADGIWDRRVERGRVKKWAKAFGLGERFWGSEDFFWALCSTRSSGFVEEH